MNAHRTKQSTQCDPIGSGEQDRAIGATTVAHREDGAGKVDRASTFETKEASVSTLMASVPSWKPLVAATAIIVSFMWSYWPTLAQLVDAWEHQPDYSHGWLVLPISLYFLWNRRAERPLPSREWAWGGLALLGLSLAMRTAGNLWFLNPLAGWSIPLWVAGVCWFLAGRPILRWSLPAIAFLAFMIPLPFRGETLLSGPLQSIATRLSCFVLQCLGEPALREGNVIIIGEQRIAVAEACSGLRIFMSIVALAFAYLLLTRKPMRTRVCLMLAVLPIALITNSLRIVVTAWMQAHVSGEAAHRFSHDAAGWLMLPVAAAFMAAVIAYSERLVIETVDLSPRDALLGRSPEL